MRMDAGDWDAVIATNLRSVYPLHQSSPPAHGALPVGEDHQHRFGSRYLRQRRTGQLRRLQGGGHWFHQIGCQGSGVERRDCQRGRSRLHRYGYDKKLAR